ncbi:MAG TPA: hypothetical protein VMV07_11360 [Streptosporangiaceae bacterium]|nr:hypothetical protein [Streptosporangiaceae bacterium]
MRPAFTIAAAVVATALAVSGWTAYLVHPAAVHTVTRIKTVTVTVSSTPKPVIKWRTRTVTRQGTAAIPCQDIGGTPNPGVITPGLPGDTSCSVTLLSPMGADHLAQIQLTAPNGDSSTWNLANPNG